jgi:hypothetical protein
MNELLKPQECCGGVLFPRLYLYSPHAQNSEESNCTHFFVVGENSGDHGCKCVKLVDLDESYLNSFLIEVLWCL